MIYRQDQKVFEFNHVYWRADAGVCEHDRRVFYSTELGFQQHRDGTECDAMIITGQLSNTATVQ